MNCKNCLQGNVVIEEIVQVSIDMAIDAGDKSMEGSNWIWNESMEICSCCNGDFENCKECNNG